jgi:hypothetical protein
MQGHASCKSGHVEEEACGLYMRPMTLDKVGDKIDGHTHFFDHIMFIFEGEAEVVGRYPDGSEAVRAIVSSDVEFFCIEAGLTHEITCTKAPYRHRCVFPSRHSNGLVAGRNTGWAPAAY